MPEYKETKLRKWGYFILRNLFGFIIRLIWIEKVEGIHNIPRKGAVIVAANHQSYFDFICFMAVSPRKIHYLAAEKFYKSLFWRILMGLTGQIKVDRQDHNKSEVYELVYSALRQGRVVGVFPEGTRSPNGKIGKVFTGVAKFALRAKVPVVPVGIVGTYDIMSRYDKLPKFTKKARIKIGTPMYFREYYDIEHTEEDFKEVTDRIMCNVAELAGKEYIKYNANLNAGFGNF